MVGVPRKPSKPVDPNQSWERAALLPMEKGSAGDVRPAVPQMLLDLWDALTLPGDVYTGKVDPMGDEGIGRAAGFPAQIAMPGLGAASAQALTQGVDPNLLNVFIGPQGARNLGTFEGFEKADRMAARRGYKLNDDMVQEIFESTGVFPGKDQKFRQELADYPARGPAFPDIDADYASWVDEVQKRFPHWSDELKVNWAKAKTKDFKGGDYYYKDPAVLPDFMYHADLMDAYPELKSLDTSLGLIPTIGQQGVHYPAYAGKPARIQAQGPTETDAMSVLLHELQHWIQTKEGFSTGGNPDFTSNVIANVAPGAGQQLELASPHTLYRALAGETEARNVQTRYELGTSMGPQMLENPLRTEDIPRNLQIPTENLMTLPGAGTPQQKQLLEMLKALSSFNE